MIRLDIFSDIVCPWCYIGKTHLDRAMESRADHPFRIEWHPFQLNPDMPREGVGHVDYLAGKFGGRERALSMMQNVAKAAKEAGAEMEIDKVAHLPNTLDAHRLIHWAGIEGRQTAMVSRLFRAHWREGLDVGDHATLARIAGEVGMDSAAVARLLATDADRDDLFARDQDARQKGVTAVPTFLIAQQYVVSGAQPVHLWQGVIDELTAKAKE
ncbi:polyketide biosynthesis protein [Gemmobacter aquarius]|uniref:Polyketide biosynthesis protein n=1 Tax=Paragemmobacter aquarius TaxID=2169400 RepID=A0A2S0UKZ7_9RHOB|nr:DsbA family oxidoreductase [Gemmobacter aquarius]AWB48483.1 polyketide biosynthesis protein [Gemmobacter aquarius]